MSKILDPRGLVKHQNATKTILMQPFFGVARSENGEAPLKIFDKFSRIVFTIIDTTQDTKAVSHNISMGGGDKRNEYSEFLSALKYARNKLQEERFSMRAATKDEGSALSRAYTQQLYTAPFKGKTPANVLLEDSDNRSKLLSMYKNLSENADTYKMNRVQMDAIREAVELFDEGALTSEQASASAMILYDSGFKPNCYKEENGLTPVTEMKVYFSPGNDYPVEYVVENYRAPVEKKENGTLNVVRSKKAGSVTHNFRIAYGDLCSDIDELERYVNAFSMVHFLGCEKDALSLEEEERKNAKLS